MKTIKTFHKIVKGSSTDVNKIGYQSVDLVVTSPPYGDVKDYDVDNESNIGNYKDKEYRKLMTSVYDECLRVLKPGRRMVVNVSDVPVITEDYGQIVGQYGQMTVDIVLGLGNVALNNIGIWTKGRCRPSTGCVGTLPYPGSPVVLNNFEYFFIFKKRGDPVYPTDTDIRDSSKVITEELKDWLYLTWYIKPEYDRRHIAPYPVDIPYRLIRLYSYVGEVVYDPFLGSGTTMQAARMAGRSSIGYEIGYQLTQDAIDSLKGINNPTWLDLIKNKISWGQQTLDPIGTVLTSPIEYNFIEDEESLSSVADLVSSVDAKDETVSSIGIESTSKSDMPLISKPISHICPEMGELRPSDNNIPAQGGVTQDILNRPLKSISVPTDIKLKRVGNLDLRSQFITIRNGCLIFLRKDAGYPYFEVRK